MTTKQKAKVTMAGDRLESYRIMIHQSGFSKDQISNLEEFIDVGVELLQELEAIYEYCNNVISHNLVATKIQTVKARIKELTDEKEHYIHEGKWKIVTSIKEQIAILSRNQKLYEELITEASKIEYFQ